MALLTNLGKTKKSFYKLQLKTRAGHDSIDDLSSESQQRGPMSWLKF